MEEGKKNFRKLFFLIAFSHLLNSCLSNADDTGLSGGLILLEPTTARSAALGNAVVASPEDIGSFASNPAMLSTLPNNQVSMLYHRGAFGESFGNVSAGLPFSWGGAGVAVTLLDAGSFELIDGNVHDNVVAQRDLCASVGIARGGHSFSTGLSVKFLTSELAERARATAVAGDLGLHYLAHPRFQIGAALQNWGTGLRYFDTSDPLPRLAKLGFSWLAWKKNFPVTLFTESTYRAEEAGLSMGTGLEINLGLVNVRGGYRSGSDLEKISLGMGFALGPAQLDYAFGLLQEFDNRHRLSLSFAIGSSDPNQNSLSSNILPNKRELFTPINSKSISVVEQKSSGVQRKVRLYKVRAGETFESIADKFYGDPQMASLVRHINRHLVNDQTPLTAGMEIILP